MEGIARRWVLGAITLLACPYWLQAQRTLYVSRWGSIYRVSLDDGTSDQIVGNGLVRPFALALDTTNEVIYWSDRGDIWKSGLDDFEQRQLVFSGVENIASLAVHPGRKLLFFSTDYAIRRLDMETGHVEDLQRWDDWTSPNVALDTENDVLYWSAWLSNSDGRIYRAQLDGSEQELLVDQVGRPVCLTLDLLSKKMYWGGTENFRRANLDGSEIETFQFVVGYDTRVAKLKLIHAATDTVTIFFTDEEGNHIYEAMVAEGDSLQTERHPNVDVYLEDEVATLGLELDPRDGMIYWTNPYQPHIRRTRIADPQPEDLLKGALIFPKWLRVDSTAGKLYWMDPGWMWTVDVPTLQRANLDGTNVEDLRIFERGEDACGLLLDPSANRMYWKVDNRIEYANLDGSGVQTLYEHPYRIACAMGIDTENDKLYWASAYVPDTLYETDISSGDTRSLFEVPGGFSLIADLSITSKTSTLYWRTYFKRKIYLTNLADAQTDSIPAPQDGTMETVTLTENEKILWSITTNSPHQGQVWQTDADGMNATLLETGDGQIFGMVLVEPVTIASEAPVRFSAISTHIYPSPASSSFTVQIAVDAPQRLEVGLYDLLGRRLNGLFEGRISPFAPRSIAVTAVDLPSGIYFVRVTGDRFESNREVVIAH